MARLPYAEDPGPSEFCGDGQWSSEGHGDMPGVGVVPFGVESDLLGWYWTDPGDPGSAPEPNGGSIGDESVHRNS